MMNKPAVLLSTAAFSLVAAGFGIRSLSRGGSISISRRAKSSSTCSLSGSTLTYFPIPALGEPARLCLALGGVDFVDERLPGAMFRERKQTFPFQQMPVLTLADGRKLTQCRAIARLAAKSATVDGKPLYPLDDDYVAFLIDETVDAVMDIQQQMSKTFNLDEEEKAAARRNLFKEGGFAYVKTCSFDAYLKRQDTDWAVCNHMTIADIFVFTIFNTFRSGFLDNIDPEFLSAFPSIGRVVAKVASHALVREYYSAKTESIYDCFKV